MSRLADRLAVLTEADTSGAVAELERAAERAEHIRKNDDGESE